MKYALLLAVACTAVTSQSAIWQFDLGPAPGGFGLNGQNERPLPMTPSPATGKEALLAGVGIQYDDVANQLTLHYGWGDVDDVDGVNLTANLSAMHIHGPADTSGSAGVLYDLIAIDNADGSQQGMFPAFGDAGGNRSGYFDFVLTLQDGVGGKTLAVQESELLGNMWYINLHTPGTYAGGEIRGQLLAIPEPEHYAAFAGLGLLGFAGYRRFKLARA
jgi:hypothetical protein